MRITLAELERHRIKASETYAPGKLNYHESGIRQIAPLQIDVNAELQGAEIRIFGHLSAKLESNCDRCLESVEIPVDTDFDLLYRSMQSIAQAEEVELPADDLEIGFFEGDGIELADVATEQVILSLPMKVVCQPDCKGLCPACRTNLNLKQCNCAVGRERDSPFASLS